ncbi:MAG: DnaB-like helicase C-terminal domain-containing protein [Candidatus Paceibacterota bacterium]
MDIKGLIDEIKASVLLPDAMEQAGIEFTSQTGDSWKAKCFMHKEQDASLTISPAKGLYHCFSTGCEAAGDVITFYQQFYSLDLKEAAFKLAADFGIDDSKYRKLTNEEKEKAKLIKISRTVAEGLHSLLMKDATAATVRDYFKKRGVSDDTLRRYEIGYCDSERRAKALAKKADASESDIGHLEFNKGNAFNERVLFPVVDPTTGARFYYHSPKNRGASSGPKYLGATGNHALRWQGAMFGLPQAREERASKERLILVEGFFDVLTLHSHGIKNVVGLLGSNPTSEQLAVLRRLSLTRVTLLLDADRAGEAGAHKLVEGRADGFDIRLAFMPSGDPDEYVIKHGRDALDGVLSESIPLADFVVNHIVDSMGSTVQERIDSVGRLAAMVKDLPAHETAIILVEVAKVLGVAVDDIKDAIVYEEEKELVQAERSVLAACLSDESARILTEARVGDRAVWSVAMHGHVWTAIRGLWKKKAKEFTSDLIRASVPTGTTLNGTFDSIYAAGTSNYEYHMGRMLEAYQRRTLKSAARRLSNAIAERGKDVPTILQEHLADVSSKMVPTSKIEFTAEEQVESAIDFVHKRMENRDELPGIDLGPSWKSFMQLTLGLQPSYLYLLSALPKVGKTTVLLNWLLATAVTAKVPAMHLSLEMSERDLALRNLSILSGISNTRLKLGAISGKEKEALDAAAAEYYASPLYLVNGSSLTLHEIINVMRKYVYSHGVKVIFVDYIQLIRNPGKQAYWEKHQEISTELKNAAATLGVPVVAASQLSKAAIEGGGAAHMGGAFKYLQDCDLAAELRRRTEKELEADPSGNLALNVEYHRHGMQDVYIKILFNHESMKCEEAE